MYSINGNQIWHVPPNSITIVTYQEKKYNTSKEFSTIIYTINKIR